MKKLILIAGIAVGYVLGTKAGRQRYEQIRSSASKVAHNPKVQAAAGKATETVTHQAAVAADAVKDTVSSAASTAADKVRREASIQPAP
ncbi:hypothetical protein [Nocardioides sp.]|jgi:hypothetical protein|uniref:hypothetical protein n=1 Tax=Nocardioides sp. TaxID=35761 RepID=UPI0031FE7AE7|nr:hypothetical protein [Nocardioides sp.]